MMLRLAGPARVLGGVIALGAAAGALAIAQGPRRFTTYSGRTALAAALMVAAGVALVAGGLVTSSERRRGVVPIIAVLAGLTWFAPVWTAWSGSPVVPSLAGVAQGFTFALVFHLAMVFPGRETVATERAWSLARWLIPLLYLETAAAAIVLAVIRDPYLDPGCLSNCGVNPFLVRSLPSTVRTVETMDGWFVAGAALVLVCVVLLRLASASRPARDQLAPVLIPAAAFAAATFIRTVDVQRTTVEDPFNNVLLVTFVIAALGLLLLAAGLIGAVLRARRQRREVSGIASDLDEAPPAGSLQAALARALGDPDLRIMYRLSDDERYVDPDGRSVGEPTSENGRVTTRLVREGRTIAIVSHLESTANPDVEIGPAVLLALENERLQAELLSELGELRASRARIVETGDAERQRLERDLHDGAQQRLLALSYDVRLARAAASEEGDARAASLLTDAIDVTQQALVELREVAHGIYPVVLAEAGLEAALRTLAESAPIAVDIVSTYGERAPSFVETAAYFAVIEAVDDAVRRGARYASVALAHRGESLIASIEDDGASRSSTLMSIEDRVGAAGGTVAFGPITCRIELPCA
jgi:signal transduction histidine kinase